MHEGAAREKMARVLPEAVGDEDGAVAATHAHYVSLKNCGRQGTCHAPQWE